MLEALKSLDLKLEQKVTLFVGGGGAMVLAHGFPIGTYDIEKVKSHIESLESKGISGATEALLFLEDIEDQLS